MVFSFVVYGWITVFLFCNCIGIVIVQRPKQLPNNSYVYTKTISKRHKTKKSSLQYAILQQQLLAQLVLGNCCTQLLRYSFSAALINRVAKKPGNLEFDKLGKIKNLEVYREIMGKPGTFFKFEFFNNFFIIIKCI